MPRDNLVPAEWDRSGLPGWTYFDPELFDLEMREVFLTHWQIAGHVSELPEPGDYICFDLGPERAVIVRGHDGELRAFHNLCRHRGARVVGQMRGRCNKAMICPYHGWAYNLDGSLRGVAEAASFPPLDRNEWGLKPVEMDLWHGFIFLRFAPGPQPPVAQIMARYEAVIAPYRCAEMIDTGARWRDELDVNWKAVRDVDNEGYHVRAAHPGLHDLYGEDYFDEPYVGGATRSVGAFNPGPSKLWSVRHYRAILPECDWLPESQRRAWIYLGLFPTGVIGLYPDSVIWYRENPVAAGQTVQLGGVLRRADEDRRMRAARYLSGRIDRDTLREDQMLTVWACEATRSSAYDGVLLSDLEYGLKTFHDHLRAVLPVTRLERPPAPGSMEAANARAAAGGA
ncbi:MAG: aromatic ring-hydroxylating dioxygenase subunit alpha [Alphaproteobacteria bacterium]|nr:MAG: aromatic ring-hydroxylating dioxygenase subunit alpha [Alphaproteobacteria bacterium]